jgi:Zn-dependent peptidase ImmA (M78 family)
MTMNELPINLNLLKWARTEMALSLDEAANRARITPLKPRGDTPGKTPEERLGAWENGELAISLRQLESLAKAYHRPVLTFFLPAPPVKKQSAVDFRVVRDDKKGGDSPEFAAFMRRIETLHEDLIALVEEEGGEAIPFVGSLTTVTPVTQAAASIRRVLGFSVDDQRQVQGKGNLLKALRLRIHDAGIFTLLEGDLGSHYTKILPNEFRGIALCHPKAPLLVVNPNDAKAAQLFTILHELTHVGLGDSSISNLSAWNYFNETGYNAIETYCNNVAAEFLVPAKEILSLYSVDIPDLLTFIYEISRDFKVSRMVIARRLMDVGMISSDEYRKFYLLFEKQWREKAQKQRESEHGPDPYVVRKSRLGDKVIGTVMGAAYEGRISLQDASRILGVKAGRFDRISG